MARRFLELSLIALSLAALPAAAQTSAEDARRQAEALEKEYQAQQGNQQVPQAQRAQAMPRVVALTEGDITRLMNTLPQLKALGMQSNLLDGSDPERMAKAMEFNSEALSILQKNGFTPQGFQEVIYSVGLAIGGLESRGREDEIASAAQQTEQMLSQMEGQLSPEQMAMMRQQMGAAMGTMKQMEDQPPGNLTLVEKYRGEIEALFNSM